MISDKEAKQIAKSYLAIGVNSRVQKTPEQMLYERIELLEEKEKNLEVSLQKIEKLLEQKFK